ncbi:MAG: hypothetical protein MZW92_07615 [Comamonadaceae bacterium]|nr:hypothetical protein [Comamonadaceae bacterium]
MRRQLDALAARARFVVVTAPGEPAGADARRRAGPHRRCQRASECRCEPQRIATTLDTLHRPEAPDPLDLRATTGGRTRPAAPLPASGLCRLRSMAYTGAARVVCQKSRQSTG